MVHQVYNLFLAVDLRLAPGPSPKRGRRLHTLELEWWIASLGLQMQWSGMTDSRVLSYCC